MALDVNKIKQDYFTFDGRIGKKQYLISFLILLGINILSTIILGMLGSIGGLLSIIVSIVVAVAMFSIAIRRFHDLGKSGWFSLLLIIPIVGLIVVIYLCIADPKAAV